MIVDGSIGTGPGGVGLGGVGFAGVGLGGVGPGGVGLGGVGLGGVGSGGVGPGGVGLGGVGPGGVGLGGVGSRGSGVGCTGADPLVVEPWNTGAWRDPWLRGSSRSSLAPRVSRSGSNALGAPIARDPEAPGLDNVAGRMSSLDEVLRIGVPLLIWRICSSGWIGIRPTPVGNLPKPMAGTVPNSPWTCWAWAAWVRRSRSRNNRRSDVAAPTTVPSTETLAPSCRSESHFEAAAERGLMTQQHGQHPQCRQNIGMTTAIAREAVIAVFRRCANPHHTTCRATHTTPTVSSVRARSSDSIGSSPSTTSV